MYQWGNVTDAYTRTLPCKQGWRDMKCTDNMFKYPQYADRNKFMKTRERQTLWFHPDNLTTKTHTYILSTRRTWTCQSRARRGDKNDPSAGAPLLWGNAKRPGAVQPGEEKAPSWPYSSHPVPEGAYKKAREGLFTRACRDRTRGNRFKVKEGRFILDLSKKFFTMRVVKHWHRLPREAVAAPSLAVFKARLDGALSNLV